MKRFWLFVFILVVCAAVFQIYRNQIYLRIFPQKQVVFKESLGGFSFELQKNLKDRSILKISSSLHRLKYGCEFMYGLATARIKLQAQSRPKILRQILRFEYDLKNKRCEAKSLQFYDEVFYYDLDLEIVDVLVEEEKIVEQPRNRVWNLSFKESRLIRSELKVKAEVHKYVWSRNDKFSLDLRPEQAELLIQPKVSIRSRVFNEIENRRSECQRRGVCGSIKLAVAYIDDPKIIAALNAAKRAGIDVQILTNQESVFLGNFDRFMNLDVWMWSRRALGEVGESLPMHTKFIIFDEDTVISLNSNFSFHSFTDSRELGVVYRSSEVASLFLELFQMIRTLVFYPLTIDLDDNFLLFFNANRPKKYSNYINQPYLVYRDSHGNRSSAYGMLFKMLEESDENLFIAMSPFTNACYSYGRKRCLFDVLKNRPKSLKTEILLNAFFYQSVHPEPIVGQGWPEHSKLQDQSFDLKDWQPALKKLSEVFGQSYSLMSKLHRLQSNHHQRYMRLGEEIVFLGSANFSHQSSLNTIEVFRSKEFALALKDEEATFDEPYFVSYFEPYVTSEVPQYAVGSCKFLIEKRLNKPYDWKKKTLRIPEKFEGWKLVELDPYSLQFDEFTVQSKLSTWSRYVCLKNPETGQHKVYRADLLLEEG